MLRQLEKYGGRVIGMDGKCPEILIRCLIGLKRRGLVKDQLLIIYGIGFFPGNIIGESRFR